MLPATTTPRATRTKTRTVSKFQVPINQPTDDQIRRRAYEIYLARGNNAGNPESDWRQAEAELRGRATLLGK